VSGASDCHHKRSAKTAPTKPRPRLAAVIERAAPLVEVELAALAEAEEVAFVLVPLRDMARALKAVKFLGPLSTALMATTMPIPQCPV